MTSTTPSHLHITRTFYDAIAEDYAERFRDGLAVRPLDRAVISGFAELVGGGGRVADLGCGTGLATAYLASLGVSVFGLDISESMLAVARRDHPDLTFLQGSMFEPGIADGALGGVVSSYSTIHTPCDELPALFAQFRRILRPGGHLLLAFQAGDVPLRIERPFGHPVTLDFQRRRPEQVAALLESAGFTLVLRSVRAADEALGESAPQAFLIARRPT